MTNSLPPLVLMPNSTGRPMLRIPPPPLAEPPDVEPTPKRMTPPMVGAIESAKFGSPGVVSRNFDWNSRKELPPRTPRSTRSATP